MFQYRQIAIKSAFWSCKHKQKLHDFFSPLIRENQAHLKKILNQIPIGDKYIGNLRNYMDHIPELKADRELQEIINKHKPSTQSQITKPIELNVINQNICQLGNVMLHHNIEEASTEDFKLIIQWMKDQPKMPQVLVEDQPIIMKDETKRIEVELETFQTEESAEQFRKSMELHITSKQVENLSGHNLQTYLKDFFTEDLFQIDYETPKIKNLQNKIYNPQGTFFMQLMKECDSISGLKVKLIDIPRADLIFDLAKTLSLRHVKKLLLLCNFTQLLERAYFLQVNEEKCCDIEQTMPRGYLNLIIGDTSLPMDVQERFIYTKIKQYLKANRSSVILVTQRQYEPSLAAMMNQNREAYQQMDYDFDDEEFIEKAVILDLIFDGMGELIVETVTKKGQNIKINEIVEYIYKYQSRLGLEYLLHKLNPSDQDYLSKIFEHPTEGCKMESLLFQQQQPIECVVDDQKDKYLRKISEL